MYKKEGKEYFLFTIEGLPREADVLVDPTTGEMFFHDVGVTQPLDKWFASWIEDHKGGNTQQQTQAPANVRIDNKSEWVQTPTTQSNGFNQNIVGVVKNVSKNAYSARIIFTLYDANGNMLGTTDASISDLPAGGTWKFSAPIFKQNVARYDFKEIAYRF